MRYWANEVRDDVGLLQERLDDLSSQGARIISVLWQPARPNDLGSSKHERYASFVIVSEAKS